MPTELQMRTFLRALDAWTLVRTDRNKRAGPDSANLFTHAPELDREFGEFMTASKAIARLRTTAK